MKWLDRLSLNLEVCLEWPDLRYTVESRQDSLWKLRRSFKDCDTHFLERLKLRHAKFMLLLTGRGHVHRQNCFQNLSPRLKVKDTPNWVVRADLWLCACVFSNAHNQLRPTLCDSPPLPGSSVHGISQARVLEWVAMPSSRGSSRPRDRTCISCTSGRFFTHWATWEAPGLWLSCSLSGQLCVAFSRIRSSDAPDDDQSFFSRSSHENDHIEHFFSPARASWHAGRLAKKFVQVFLYDLLQNLLATWIFAYISIFLT